MATPKKTETLSSVSSICCVAPCNLGWALLFHSTVSVYIFWHVNYYTLKKERNISKSMYNFLVDPSNRTKLCHIWLLRFRLLDDSTVIRILSCMRRSFLEAIQFNKGLFQIHATGAGLYDCKHRKQCLQDSCVAIIHLRKTKWWQKVHTWNGSIKYGI